jgi:hypothetical protein
MIKVFLSGKAFFFWRQQALALQFILEDSIVVLMLYPELPSFNSRHAWTLDQLPDDSYRLDEHILQPISTSMEVSAPVSGAELERLRYLQSLTTRGTNALDGSTEQQRLEELSAVNDSLAAEPTYALLHTRMRVWGQPEQGRAARIAILRGFVLDLGSPNPQHQMHRVIEGKNGKLGRRYDPVQVMLKTAEQ